MVDPDSKKVRYYNNFTASYCGIKRSGQKTDFAFFEEFIHPDDIQKFVDQLESCGNTQGPTEDISVRIRKKNGAWENFRFINRQYKTHNETDQRLILCQGVSSGWSADPEDEKTQIEELKKEYEQLVNSLDEGFCIVEVIEDENEEPVDFFILQTNPAFAREVGLKNAVGRTIRELVKQPKENWVNRFSTVARTGKPVRFQESSRNLDGRWLDIYAFKVGTENSRQVAILFRDITSRKLAEEQIQKALARQHKHLQESEKLLQTTFDTTNLGIAVLRAIYDESGKVKDFVFLRVNRVLKEMYLERDIVGLTYLETSKYGQEMGIFDAFKEAVTNGKAFDREFFFDRDGYMNWFRVTARAQDDLLITTIEDVTERKKEAEELQETLKFKRELVRTTPEVIMIINLNTYRVRYINKDLVPETGLTRENIEGKPLQEILPFIHPRDREKVMQLHRTLLKASPDDILDIEVRLKLEGTSWEWFSVRGKIFHRRDASWVDEYVLLVRNITDLKNTQKALINAETLSIKGEVARTFAHELRNPMASIGMVSEVLSKKLPKEQQEEFANYFEILKRSTKTLNTMVANLLNASKYTPAVLEKKRLDQIVRDALTQAADRIYLSGIEVKKKLKPLYIMADSEKLGIALLNIIVNASEATEPGKGVIQIEMLQEDSEVLLVIRDNGHGLEPGEIERLFEAFYTKKDTGIGVGLNSVKNILEEHDATIQASSEPGKGTTFRLSFHDANIA